MFTALMERLRFSPEEKVISIVGSGGKTTLMFALAQCFLGLGQRVAVTTTTHIQRPAGEPLLITAGEDFRELAEALALGKIVVAGRPAESGKLSAPSDRTITFLCTQADRLLVEADGSRRLPVKLPNLTEPVLPLQTSRVIAVAGLSALGRPLGEVCHRWELARERFGYPPKKLVTEEIITNLLLYGYGNCHPTVLLNQADTPKQKRAGVEIAKRLRARGVRQVLITSFTNQEVFDYADSD